MGTQKTALQLNPQQRQQEREREERRGESGRERRWGGGRRRERTEQPLRRTILSLLPLFLDVSKFVLDVNS